jgi:hypothetical protein
MAKKPKRPKKSASLATWAKYDQRVTQWEHDRKKKEHLIKKHHG